MTIQERQRHRSHLAHLWNAARELDENIELARRELAKSGDETTDVRVSLLLAHSCSAMSADRLEDAIRRLPDVGLRVAA